MHNQPNTGSNTFNVSNEELGIIRGLFEMLAKLPNHVRYDTIAWAIEGKDPTMLKLIALCQFFGLSGYVHYYFLTPDKFRKSLFSPSAGS